MFLGALESRIKLLFRLLLLATLLLRPLLHLTVRNHDKSLPCAHITCMHTYTPMATSTWHARLCLAHHWSMPPGNSTQQSPSFESPELHTTHERPDSHAMQWRVLCKAMRRRTPHLSTISGVRSTIFMHKTRSSKPCAAFSSHLRPPFTLGTRVSTVRVRGQNINHEHRDRQGRASLPSPTQGTHIWRR